MATKTKKSLLAADSTDLVFLTFMKHLHENFLSEFGNHSFTWDVGSKYIRVWANTYGNSRHSYCFVERATGNVFKCASWKIPAKHSRGNLYDGFNDTNLYGVTQYGANYMR